MTNNYQQDAKLTAKRAMNTKMTKKTMRRHMDLNRHASTRVAQRPPRVAPATHQTRQSESERNSQNSKNKQQ
eukprot:7317845-Pyramimonas_sp.AAC.1